MSALGSSSRPSTRLLGLLVAGVAALALTLTGCTADGDPGAGSSAGGSDPAPETSAQTPTGEPSADPNQLVIDITLFGGDQVNPNGKKVDVEQGQTVVLNVTSDRDDEIHVHGDIEVAIPVTADGTASDSFVAEDVGSFEVESHHPNKIIAILNVR